MPKPVLSDSLFNASNVAEAIVDAVDFGVINTNLGVTDVSANFTNTSPYGAWAGNRAFTMNGFVFIALTAYRSSSGASDGDEVFNITDSNLYPSQSYNINSVSHEGDTAERFVIQTSGNIIVKSPYNPGQSAFHVIINAWYRI